GGGADLHGALRGVPRPRGRGSALGVHGGVSAPPALPVPRGVGGVFDAQTGRRRGGGAPRPELRGSRAGAPGARRIARAGVGPDAGPPSSARPARSEDFATRPVLGGRIREGRPRATRPALAPGPTARPRAAVAN